MNIAYKKITSIIHAHAFGIGVFIAVFAFIFFSFGLIAANGQTLQPSDSHIVNLYVDDKATSAPTRASTVGDFLQKADIEVKPADLVEPSLDTPIDADNFNIEIYRARPVTITDSVRTVRVLTPHQTPEIIAKKAGFSVYPEDKFTFSSGDSFIQESLLGEKLTIDYATPVLLSLYGSPIVVYRTHAGTVGDFIQEQGIIVEEGSKITPSSEAPIQPNMAIVISKNGVNIAVSEEEVPFNVESKPDPTKQNGIISITKAGVKGKKQVVYELELREGREIGRKKIQEVITMQPQTQEQTVGSKPSTGLTKARGAIVFTDSKGVTHRETYYDLPMSIVMNSCGAGGQYSVRGDGAKIDKDGYILVAANYAIYPKCSIVETSIGLGKVYDTGGFVLVHPHGFDLATDWTNNNGR